MPNPKGAGTTRGLAANAGLAGAKVAAIASNTGAGTAIIFRTVFMPRRLMIRNLATGELILRSQAAYLSAQNAPNLFLPFERRQFFIGTQFGRSHL
jgi:hypothetical protein